MAQIKPTRQELLRFKKKLKTASRGHRLLKDKRDGLIRQFLSIVKEATLLRKSVLPQLIQSLEFYRYAEAKSSTEYLAQIAHTSESRVLIHPNTTQFMGVIVPELSFEVTGDPFHYGVLRAPKDLDQSLTILHSILPDLIKLAELEYTARKLADEIEKTRRRVNSLEHRLIPDTEKDIRYIKSVLEERTRQEKVTIMKVKEFLETQK